MKISLLPSSCVVSVDTYNSEDWQKLKAAVNVLKNPVLDDSVLLDASAIGQYLHKDYIYSQSTPSIDNITEEELVRGRNFGPFHQANGDENGLDGIPRRARRASEGLVQAYTVQVSSDPSESHNESHTRNSYASNLEGNMIHNWVAGLPEYGRRSRAHTDPMRPLLAVGGADVMGTSPSKSKTLPSKVSEGVHCHDKGEGVGTSMEVMLSPEGTIYLPDAASPPVQPSALKRTSVRSSSPSGGSDTRASSSLQSPTTPVAPNSKVLKIFMTRVQKGIHNINDLDWGS